MPLISERVGAAGMEPATPTQPNQAPLAMHPPEHPLVPNGSPFLRCPLPPIFASNPDSLRTFYQGCRVPQTRIYSQQLKGNS